MKIMLIDDNNENLYMLETLLEGHGFETFTSSNGQEALELLENQSVDLIISDILMPVMDGFTFCKKIRMNTRHQYTPIIIYTATYTGPQDETLALKMGANKFIIKPCEPETLMGEVNKLLSSTEANRTTPATAENEEEVLKLYNERLVRKLEQKMLEAEAEVENRLQIEVELLNSERMLKDTQRIGKIGGWRSDVDSGAMHWTEETYRIHDLNPDDFRDDSAKLVGYSLQCYPEPDREAIMMLYEKCIQNGAPYQYDCAFTTYAQRQLYIRTAGYPMYEDDRIVAVGGYIQDITEQKNAELEGMKLREQLAQTQKLDSIGRLAGGIAHDFNNLLTVILGYGEDALNSLSPHDKVHGDISEIIKAGNRAMNLTRQLLAFSKKNQFKSKVVDVNYIVTDLKAMLFRIIGEDIKFETHLCASECLVKADPSQIEQVFLNLVINAREAMPLGGTITIETELIPANELQDSRQKITSRKVMIRVRDTGTGMSQETMKHVFEPFFTTKDSTKGTGLGLSTVYGIIKQSGGDIVVESIEGSGTCFTLCLPETLDKLDCVQNISDNMSLAGNGEHILVIEDDNSVRRLVQKTLTEAGYTVVTSESADKATQLLQNGMKPDLIICDIIMPGMNGIEFTKATLNINPDVSIILISGYASSGMGELESMSVEIPFIQKPFTKTDLLGQVMRSLENKVLATRLRILMIDDDEDIRILMNRACLKKGFFFNGVGTLDSALNALQKDKYNLILVDKNIPGSDGLTIIQEIRKSGYQIPVIIVSGIGLDIDEEMAIRQNIISVLEKDASCSKLLNKIEDIVIKSPRFN